MAWIVAMRNDYMHTRPAEPNGLFTSVVSELLITKAEFIRLFSLLTAELTPAKLSDSFKKLSEESAFADQVKKSTSKIRIAILSDLCTL